MRRLKKMIINSIKITNFRCYYGTNSLSFNSNGKITLIYGDSGYGKSSLLQFFKWMFYNDADFGKNDDKPLFNIPAYKEHSIGDTIEVSGQIDFEHLGISYRLNRTSEYQVAFKIENSELKTSDYKLLIKGDDDGYHPFSGNVANQINSILPKELSKYFLLDGERSRDIVLDSSELKKAIYSLFGLDVYTEALAHIGTNRNAKTTVLGHYALKMAQNAPQLVGGISISELQEAVQNLNEEISDFELKRKDIVNQIEQKENRNKELFMSLGAVTSKSIIDELIKAKQQKITDNDKQITALQHNIGDLFYRTYPYLFLAKIASESSSVLRKKNSEYASNYKNVFENLKKDLLKEILEKDMCVCGRELNAETRKRINGIIDIMPPGSYIYEFGQFVSKAKNRIREAQKNLIDYEQYTSQIGQLESENSVLESEIQDKLNELKHLDEAKDLIDELENIKKELSALNSTKEEIDEKIATKKSDYTRLDKKLSELLKNSIISNQYGQSIDFFEEVSNLIRTEKDSKEAQIKVTLNNCVRDIFKKLTTQTELEADKIQFVNDDFSLRTTYLTGGQLAVDVYSYVIGIVKALQECNVENDENPIIVDAPFAFTGNEQSEHIFKTLPTVSKQTILLTLDLNKIKNLLEKTELYDFYIIKNDTQEKATIMRGDINDIEF